MDRVLGLSMTSKVLRWVLVDGVTGEGAAVDRGALDIEDVEAFDAEALLETLLAGGHLHAVGLTWSQGAEAAAIKVREALAIVGGGVHAVAVTDVEATEVLASGIAEVAGYDFLVVCNVEPDATVVAKVNSQRVATERIDCADSVPLIERVSAVVRGVRPSPDAIFVLGSDGADGLASALRDVTTRPVITAAEAQFALTRGAALASARAIKVPDAPGVKPRISRVGVRSLVLAAAVMVFIVSLSLVVVPRVTPESNEQPHNSTAADQTGRPAAPPPAAPAAAPPVRETVAAAVPPVPEVLVPPAAPAAPAAPADVPPAAAPVAPPLVYEPPVAEPVYVPPVAPPQPRLRDRIIEKVPLLNRFR